MSLYMFQKSIAPFIRSAKVSNAYFSIAILQCVQYAKVSKSMAYAIFSALNKLSACEELYLVRYGEQFNHNSIYVNIMTEMFNYSMTGTCVSVFCDFTFMNIIIIMSITLRQYYSSRFSLFSFDRTRSSKVFDIVGSLSSLKKSALMLYYISYNNQIIGLFKKS